MIMQIDRSNYEIWLIDWLDGNLDDLGVAQLQLFLRDNPDIKEELDELMMFRLNSQGETFHRKNNLKKTTFSLPESQFEYLCAAFLENDLSSEQKAELKEIIENDPLKKKTYDLIRKTKLSPPEVSFKHKKRLLRRTFARDFARISVIGLSAAAITALLIIIYVLKPEPLPDKTLNTAQNAVPVSTVKEPLVSEIPEKTRQKDEKVPVKETNSDLLSLSKRKSSPANGSNITANNQTDSIPRRSDPLYSSIAQVPVSFSTEFKGEVLPNDLIALNQTLAVPPFNDGRSKISRFIAKTFREKILKEKTAKDSPLKGYEIAEAGVSGLNKLLGWEMALDEKKDENGELRSVYFSSRILKFNAPVKKSEPLQ
jgi:hypothetical protein